MNISSLKDVGDVNPGADSRQIAALERRLPLPPAYRALLATANGFLLDDGVKVYSTDELEERNATLEVAVYAPGWLAIGDDSGGRCVLMSLATGALGHVDMGSMDPAWMEPLAGSLDEWIDSGCPLDD